MLLHVSDGRDLPAHSRATSVVRAVTTRNTEPGTGNRNRWTLPGDRGNSPGLRLLF